MPARPTCPKCDKPAYRAYSQVQHPETHRSTSVPIPAVMCGEAGFADGHGTISGGCGLVVLPKGTFAAQVRNSRAATRRLTRAQRKGGKPAKTDKAGRAIVRPTGAKKAAAKPAKKAARRKPAAPKAAAAAPAEGGA